VPRYKTSEVSFNIGIQSATTTTTIENNSTTSESRRYNLASITAQLDMPPRLNIPSQAEIHSMSEVPSQAGGTSQEDIYDVIRGDAPLCVDGVSVRATHQSYTDEHGDLLETSRDFYFAGKDEASSETVSAAMNIPLGINEFVASSIASDYAYAHSEKYESIGKYKKRWKGDTRWEFHRDQLALEHPVYADFTGTTTVEIKDNNPSINIDMTTQQSRLNIVFENKSRFYATYYVFYALNYSGHNYVIENQGRDVVSAVVLNSDDLANSPINVYVRYSNRDSNWYYDWSSHSWKERVRYTVVSQGYIRYNGSYDIIPESGLDKTIVFQLNKRR
jgi:hypothetical protein